MLCLHVCLHSLYMRVPEPLEQELYVVVSHHVVLGILEEWPTILTSEPSFHPLC